MPVNTDPENAQQKAYLAEIAAANEVVSQIVSEHAQRFDLADLFRIVMNLRLTPEERLERGLRRRRFGTAL